MKNLRQSPSGPKRVFSVETEFPEIFWSGDVNPPFPPGKIGEGHTTKSSSVQIVGIEQSMGVLCTIKSRDLANNIIFTFGLPFSFGFCIIEADNPIVTPFGIARNVWLGVSYLQALGPGENISTGGPTPVVLTFFALSSNLQVIP